MAGAKIIGAEALKRELEAIGREAREKLPGVAARALASASIESFRNAALRPVPARPFVPVLPDGKMSPLAEKRLKAAMEDALKAMVKSE